MKYIYFIFTLLSLSLVHLHAQNERIQNTQLSLDGDRLVITYDITPGGAIGEISIVVKTNTGQAIPAYSLSGDVGLNIASGKSKRIVWNMAVDQVNVGGQEINVTVVANSTKKELINQIEEVSYFKKPLTVRDKVVTKTGEKYYGVLESQIAQNGQFILLSKNGDRINLDGIEIKKISYLYPKSIKNTLILKDKSKLIGRIQKIDPITNTFEFKSSIGIRQYALNEISKIETAKGRGYFYAGLQATTGIHVGYLDNWGAYLSAGVLPAISTDGSYYYNDAFTIGLTKRVLHSYPAIYLIVGGGVGNVFYHSSTFNRDVSNTPLLEGGGMIQLNRITFGITGVSYYQLDIASFRFGIGYTF